MIKPAHPLILMFALMVAACTTTDAPNRSKSQMIDVATAKVLHDEGAAFIDLRNKHWYNQGHIPGAINIPIAGFNDDRLARHVAQDQAVVFYCYGISCEYSNKASNQALIWGYQNVSYFMKGYPGWLNADYPVER